MQEKSHTCEEAGVHVIFIDELTLIFWYWYIDIFILILIYWYTVLDIISANERQKRDKYFQKHSYSPDK